jgi:flagellar basal-body rod protein FlgF
MDAAMYKALSAAVMQMYRLEVSAQDLSNVNTSGYKGQRLAFQEVLATRAPADARAGGFVAVGEQRTDKLQGHHQSTGNPFHLAIEGDGYFVVESDRGERYTRSGVFSLNPDGVLATSLGEPVLGENGPVQLEDGKLEVGVDGTLRSGAVEIGRLRVERFLNPHAVMREGANLLRSEASNVEVVSIPKVVQGSLEQSNVNPVDSMVSLITIQRGFETYERAMKLMDGVTERTIAESGR